MAHYSFSPHNFLFIHVPKNGGVSILNMIRDRCSLQSVQDLRDKRGLPRSGWDDNHYTYETVIKTFQKTATMYEKPTVFGVIRDPFTRMVSLYTHRLRKPQYNTEEDNHCLAQGFEHWLLNTQHRSDKVLTRMSQMRWFDGADDARIIKHEALNAEFFRTVTGILDLPDLQKHNVSNVDHGLYKNYHTDKTREHIYKYFGEELNKYYNGF